MGRIASRVVVALMAATGGAGPTGGQELFGTAYQGPDSIADLYQIDPTTGGSTVIGSTGFQRVGGIDFDPLTGQLYGFGERNDGSNTQVLITIDPTTGAGTEVGATNLGSNVPPTDLSFRSDGTLFGFTDAPEQLHTLDLMTGAATLVGNVDPFDGLGNAIAFDPTDLLFWAGGNDGDNSGNFSNLLDQITGEATNITAFDFPTDCDNPRIAGADFDDGQAFGSLRCEGPGDDDRLVQVDFTTGEITEVGPFTSGGDEQLAGVDGLAFRTEPVSPE